MIKAIIFDLDGTLIQTEVLKAASYAKAIYILTDGAVAEKKVMQAFENFVGLPRNEVVKGVYETFKTELKNSIGNLDPEAIQHKIITKRLSIYHAMLDDYTLLVQHFCPYSLGLLQSAFEAKLRIALATMSHFREAKNVIDKMRITKKLDLILTRDDVKNGKPNPEIYLKASNLLKIKPKECLVIEDSVNGLKAALAAKMNVFAVTNSVTKKSVHASNLLHAKYIIDSPENLSSHIFDFIEQNKNSF